MAPQSGHKQFLLWIVSACVATTGLGGILVWERKPAASRHALYVIGIPEKGAALFFGEKKCGICHSVNGQGGRVAPDLARVHAGRPGMPWLATTLWNHAPGMWRQMRGAKFPDLDQEEMAHILAFLYQAETSDPAGNPKAGARVFLSKGCSHCHAVRSVGGHSAPELTKVAAAGSAVQWMHAMWNHTQSMIDPITRELGGWPQFKGDEMNDLIAYVRGVPVSEAPPAGNQNVLRGSAERGWQVFQGKCIQCHAVGGNGGHIGPELGPDHDLPFSSSQFAAVLWNHAPAMLEQARAAGIAAPVLQDEELSDVLQFLVSLRYHEPSGSPFLGERVFAERGCARCHGLKAEGTREGPQLKAGNDAFTTVSLASALWRHGPSMRAHAERLGIAWPTLEPNDMGDLISFLNDTSRAQ